jgi:F0F1-type ATP synthase delta subunit
MVPEQHRKMVGLPTAVVSPVDLGRLVREMEAIDNGLLQAHLRDKTADIKLPKTSKLLEEMVALNKVNLLDDADRTLLTQFLEAVKEKAPTMHISFSADPSPLFVDKLISWLRDQIHPLILMTIGMQPDIGAGCVIRTTNKHFDLSLARHLSEKRAELMKSLRGSTAP